MGGYFVIDYLVSNLSETIALFMSCSWHLGLPYFVFLSIFVDDYKRRILIYCSSRMPFKYYKLCDVLFNQNLSIKWDVTFLWYQSLCSLESMGLCACLDFVVSS